MISTSVLKGQETKNSYCFLLQQIIETPIFNREFLFTQNLNEELIIVDTCNIYSGCSFNTIKERKVVIINTMPTKIEIGNNNILIASFREKKDCFISFGFWNYGTGRLLGIHYEVEKEKYKLLGYRLGDL